MQLYGSRLVSYVESGLGLGRDRGDRIQRSESDRVCYKLAILIFSAYHDDMQTMISGVRIHTKVKQYMLVHLV